MSLESIARSAIDEAFAEQLKLRFAALASAAHWGDVDGQAFRRGIARLGETHKLALQAIDAEFRQEKSPVI